ncbi:type II CRISPR RNA-guided endonuclease Cas9 [Tenacibaculum sp. IB213877]|uniref:type II CRISPR RNA-guided endonuclease Cas9 n=1 Tax=Tenacibaculum sp. IB213877 TaxID=3097351 RepID=UPI002A59BFA4|nr:type II CRISPR RNA-guided endonuclease Cas9 [Tenacibaculum sp. IB213877]MDY0780380.1 HNH endonuclease domain-containing protein [Tenacibaculum sp. IB213877]
MAKKILGLDLGTNSIGWAFIQQDFNKKEGKINGLGCRIIPMSQDILDNFGKGQSHSQTADRTSYRGVRRLYQRDNLRRERLHRVLNILDFLPKHYKQNIDFDKKLGQFKKEVKFNYQKNKEGKFDFLFMDSFNEMVDEFKIAQPQLFYKKGNGTETKIPLDWTIYYLRKKALSKKISKQELAWILLNFNQKRGYYQLRGEEEDNLEGKTKTFETLKIDKVEDSGETIKGKGEKLYDIYFDNGWKYDKQTTTPKNWLNKTKEFIVTTSTLKNNSIKRTFKTVDSEKDWIAIKKKTEQDVNKSGKTVGEYIYETLLANPTQKIRGKLIKTIERKFYKKELRAILKKQIELHSELQDRKLYNTCIQNLYSKNKAHRNNIKDKGFDYLFLDDIIFYQRPLKSKKSTIAICQYETRTFFKENTETGKKEKTIKALKAIPKSHPLFIEFRLWQFLHNLKIYHKQDKNNIDITSKCIQNEEEWCDLFDFLIDKKEIEQKEIIDYLIKKNRLEKKLKEEYRWNYVEDRKMPINETKAQFISCFKKVEGFDLSRLTISFQLQLWHIIYSVKDKNEFDEALKTFANKNNIDEATFVEHFKKIPSYKSEYGAYSVKAIKKLLPLLRIGRYWNENDIPEDVKHRIKKIIERIQHLQLNEEQKITDTTLKEAIALVADDEIPSQFIKSFLKFKDKNPLKGLNTYQACYAVYERHSEVSEITQWKTSADITAYLKKFKQHSLRNPIVEQVVTETLRTVRDIWNYYGDGATRFFDEIHVELGRDMKNSADKRKKIANRNSENERTNQRIKELLKELKSEYTNEDIRPYSPSHQEILKIYEEGVYQNPEVAYNTVSEDDIQKIRKNNSPTKSEITRYKLWLEQGYISPYTGKIIPLSRLFSSEYQIEHIIPQSRYFDDSLNNKVICESEINPFPYKGNQLAYNFITSQGGTLVQSSFGKEPIPILKLKEYEAHCSKYFKKNRTKLKNLLSEDIPEGFIERQINDSRYIAKVVKSLLSNIVREEGERESTSKNLLPTPGAVTNRLKQNWGLNDKWNELIAPRFKRLNEITNSDHFGEWDEKINAFRTKVPDEIAKNGFSKKRIDHRHHALDALVIACTTQDHTNYLHALEAEKENFSLRDKLLIKSKEGDYTKHFQLPWQSFPFDAKNQLEKTIVSFKQNLRVINKTNNKTWQWKKQKDGNYKKELVKQTKGKNWAIRKALHKETISGSVKIKKVKKGLSSLTSYIEKTDLIVDKQIKQKIKSLHTLFDKDVKKIKKHLKDNPLEINGKKVEKIQVYEWTKGATATRTALSDRFTRKQLEAVTDSGIRKILENHLKNYIDENGKEQFDIAFNPEGVEKLNKNIVALNNGKKHQPIYKVRLYEVGSKFAISDNENNPKSTKYVEAAKGTNLFFAIYWNKEQQKRMYETIPLNEVIQHQKTVTHIPKKERTPIQPKAELGTFKFTLSPNDLVYVPTKEEIENSSQIDLKTPTREQINNIYKMVSSSGNQCFFIKNEVAKVIANKLEYSSLNKMEKDIQGIMIKSVCWKLETDRLGNIIEIIK